MPTTKNMAAFYNSLVTFYNSLVKITPLLALQKAWKALQWGTPKERGRRWQKRAETVTAQGEGSTASIYCGRTHLMGQHFILCFPLPLRLLRLMAPLPVAEALSRAGSCSRCWRTRAGTGRRCRDTWGERAPWWGPRALLRAAAVRRPGPAVGPALHRARKGNCHLAAQKYGKGEKSGVGWEDLGKCLQDKHQKIKAEWKRLRFVNYHYLGSQGVWGDALVLLMWLYMEKKICNWVLPFCATAYELYLGYTLAPLTVSQSIRCCSLIMRAVPSFLLQIIFFLAAPSAP